MRVLYITFFVILADQITKILVKGITIPFLNIHISGMRYAESYNIIGDFFKLTFVENPGMAFGIDLGFKGLLSTISILASIAILVYLYKHRTAHLLSRISLAFILGGAVGNLIDRVFYGVIYGYAPLMYGKVVDFLNVEFFDFTLFGHTYERFPIFNIADAAVSCGVFVLIIFSSNKKGRFDHSELEDYEELPMISVPTTEGATGTINNLYSGNEKNEPADNRKDI